MTVFKELKETLFCVGQLMGQLLSKMLGLCFVVDAMLQIKVYGN
jgi:hypothetical protein